MVFASQTAGNLFGKIIATSAKAYGTSGDCNGAQAAMLLSLMSSSSANALFPGVPGVAWSYTTMRIFGKSSISFQMTLW